MRLLRHSPRPVDDDLSEWGNALTHATSTVTGALGSFPAILLAFAIIIVWAVSGPMFGFSDTWQLIINTFTTLVTFVMVFIIQNTQNRDGRAMQAKLDDILNALRNADSRLVGLEDAPERLIKREQDRIHVKARDEVNGDEASGGEASGHEMNGESAARRPQPEHSH